MKNNLVAELKRIAADNDGILQPEVVVEEARPKESPLHSRFEWDNTVAGQRYRIWQARQLIAVMVEVLPGISENVSVFVSLTTDRKQEGGGYRVMTTVISDAEMRKRMLADAIAELRLFQQKYARLKELAGLFGIIRKLTKKRK